MKRLYSQVIEEHFREHRQMLFLTGPRQVGKTTTSTHTALNAHQHYLNWDNREHRALILAGPSSIAQIARLDELSKQTPLIIFDEIHKFKSWKDFLKGFFDTYPKSHILVTGSARLDLKKRAGDSLMGRYFPYRVHPLSVGEILNPATRLSELNFVPQRLDETSWESLYLFGGFPEPFLKANARFYHRWRSLRLEQLFRSDILELQRIQDIGQMEILAEMLKNQAGSLTSTHSLGNKLTVSTNTVRSWIGVLKSFYYCYDIKPWSRNISRSLLKEPKYYLWDWSWVEDKGAKFENFIASHLLKAVHYWTDQGFGNFDLYFLRDKEQREVDFLVTKNQKPWFLVEAKHSASAELSPNLAYFQKQTAAQHAFQVVLDMPFVDRDCFSETQPIKVPAKTFLSQLI